MVKRNLDLTFSRNFEKYNRLVQRCLWSLKR